MESDAALAKFLVCDPGARSEALLERIFESRFLISDDRREPLHHVVSWTLPHAALDERAAGKAAIAAGRYEDAAVSFEACGLLNWKDADCYDDLADAFTRWGKPLDALFSLKAWRAQLKAQGNSASEVEARIDALNRTLGRARE